MTKLDAGLITPLPASDPGSAAVWGSKRINPGPQSCLCLTCSGCPSNDDDDDDDVNYSRNLAFYQTYLSKCSFLEIQSNIFSKSIINIKICLLAASYFFIICFIKNIASIVSLPGINPICILSMLNCFLPSSIRIM